MAAKDHCKNNGPEGKMGHEGADGSKPDNRMDRYGSRRGHWGENIAYGMHSGTDVVAGLFVDDGVPGRGHRTNMMKPEFTQCGVGEGPFAKHDWNMTTLNYASGYEAKMLIMKDQKKFEAALAEYQASKAQSVDFCTTKEECAAQSIQT